MKVSELTGELLDYWVARANGWVFGPQHKTLECDVWRDADGCIVGTIPAQGFRPSSDWGNGGPIIEREKLELTPCTMRNHFVYWSSQPPGMGHLAMESEMPLVAAMRAYVASKFGDEVEGAKAGAERGGE